MYRSDWEMAVLVRHRIAELADEGQRSSPLNDVDHGAARVLTQLRQRLGNALIQAGHALGGDDGVGGLPTPPARFGMGGSGCY